MSIHHAVRLLAVAGVVAVAIALAAAPAVAHIDPDPSTVKPGKTATVAFNVEHGCGTSPTTMLTFKIPKGVKRVQPQPKTGWQAGTPKGTVVFSGGPLDAHTEDTFSITFTAPKKKTVLLWKVIQQCVQGVNRWIDTAKDADEPPPRVGVGKKVKNA